MDTLNVLSSVLTYLAVIYSVFVVLKSAMSIYYFKQKQKEIQVLVSKLSLHKLRLKTRLKKKSCDIANGLKNNPLLLELINPQLEEICNLEFTKATDFNLLIKNLIYINKNIALYNKLNVEKSETQSEIPPDLKELHFVDTDKENIKNLFASDRINILTIFEIIELYKELSLKIYKFNRYSKFDRTQKKINADILTIELDNMYLLSEMVKADRENTASSKNESTSEVSLAVSNLAS